MNRMLTLCTLALTACGGLTPLGTFEDTGAPIDTADPDPDGTDPDPDSDSDPVVTGGSPPRIDSFVAADLGSQISVAFTVSDSDGDLAGGTFELTVNGQASAFDVPGSLSTWDASTGSGTIRVPTPATGGGSGCSGGSANFSINGIMEDAAGQRSSRATTSVSVSTGGSGVPTNEVGDSLSSVYDAGTIQVPCTMAGNVYATGATGDLDIVSFAVSSGASNVGLNWSSTGDYDLYIFDTLGFIFLELFDGDLSLAPPLAYGENIGSTPESVSVSLIPGEVYYAIVVGYDGAAGDYSISVQ